jgi:hypothetical protein
MAPRLCVRSIVVAAALPACAIYGRPPSRAGGKAAASDDATKTSVTRRGKGRRKRRRHKDLRRAGAQSWQVVDSGTFLSYSPFVIFLLYLPQKTLRLRASAGDSIVGCWLVCGSV